MLSLTILKLNKKSPSFTEELFLCTDEETPFDCAQDKLLASPLILEFSKNKKANSLKLAFLLSTGGETRTLTPRGTRS